MSQFFRQLIDLGEEEKGETTRSTREDISELTHDELIAALRKLEAKLAEQRQEYEKLQSDSLSLRSEYDAYKRKVDSWQRQMKEARAADRKMIDELRAAGSTGKIDDVYMKTTSDTIQQLKESLRDAQEEVQKAFKRQREAEESRVAAEQTKKQELEELGAKFETFKERSRSHQERLERQLAELRKSTSKDGSGGGSPSTVAQLRTQLEASERQRAALQRRVDALGADADSSIEVSRGAAGESDGSAVGRVLVESTSALHDEISQLNAQLAASAAKESELVDRLRRTEEKLQRQAEDSQWETLEAGKKLVEAKSEVEMLKTKLMQLESKADAREEECALNERQMRRAVRDLEDALALEKERRAADQREAQQQRQKLEHELQLEREKLAHHTELIGEAETASKKTNEALEAQRKHFEKILAEKDVALQQQNSVRESLELALQDAKTDSRHRMDIIDDLRREVEQSAERTQELEHQLLILQRSLTLREEEVQSREVERQKLRAQLRHEEDGSTKLRSTVTNLELRLTEFEWEHRRKDAQIADLESSRNQLTAELEAARATMDDLNKTLRQQENHIQDLNRRMQDQSLRNSDILRIREDQNASIKYLEQRNAELEQDLRLARNEAHHGSGSPVGGSVATGAASHASSGFGTGGSSVVVDVLDAVKSTPALIKKQFVSDAMAAMRQQRSSFLSLSNYRQIIMVAVGVVLLLTMLSGFHTTKEASLTDSETINTLREKYGQSLVSAGMCREALSAAKEQISSLCPCGTR